MGASVALKGWLEQTVQAAPDLLPRAQPRLCQPPPGPQSLLRVIQEGTHFLGLLHGTSFPLSTFQLTES